MPKLIWEKKLQEAVKLQQCFGWAVSEMKGSRVETIEAAREENKKLLEEG